MKKTIKTFAVAGAMTSLLSVSSVFAAATNIAVINIQEVIAKVPQSVAIKDKLTAELKGDADKIAELEKEIKYQQEKLKRDGALMSEQDKKDTEQKIATSYQQYQMSVQAFQKKSTVRQNEEMNKLFVIVKQTVDSIATKNKYDLVLDKKAVLFSKENFDITNAVVEQVSKKK